MTQFCSRSFCTAVDGGFSEWTPFSACSVTCGSGVKVRTRTCASPPRQWKGKDCVGPRQESMACNEGPCKWYTNPWSQNKLGWKTIIGKAACSQRAGLGWGREACFLYSSTYLRPNMWLPTPLYSDQKNIHNSSPCSKKDKYSSYFTPKRIRSISNLGPKENNPYLSSRITAI